MGKQHFWSPWCFYFEWYSVCALHHLCVCAVCRGFALLSSVHCCWLCSWRWSYFSPLQMHASLHCSIKNRQFYCCVSFSIHKEPKEPEGPEKKISQGPRSIEFVGNCCCKDETKWAWLQEAEGNPWSQPQLSVLLPMDPSLLEDGTLCETSSSHTNKLCGACSIKTWEEKCWSEEKTVYKLSIKEQSKTTSFLRCTNCGSNFCNLCAELFRAELNSFINEVEGEQEKKGNVKEVSADCCFSCQHKQLPSQPVSTAQDCTIKIKHDEAKEKNPQPMCKKQWMLWNKYKTKAGCSIQSLDCALYFLLFEFYLSPVWITLIHCRLVTRLDIVLDKQNLV